MGVALGFAGRGEEWDWEVMRIAKRRRRDGVAPRRERKTTMGRPRSASLVLLRPGKKKTVQKEERKGWHGLPLYEGHEGEERKKKGDDYPDEDAYCTSSLE